MDDRFLKGLQLFNEGKYFESHEVIEELWLETPPNNPYRDLYKGVIQAAAAIYQFDRGVLTGAEGLYKTSIQYLDRYKPVSLGLNVDKLIHDMRICFKDFDNWDKKKIIKRAFFTPKLDFNLKLTTDH